MWFWHTPERNFIRNVQDIYPWYAFENNHSRWQPYLPGANELDRGIYKGQTVIYYYKRSEFDVMMLCVYSGGIDILANSLLMLTTIIWQNIEAFYQLLSWHGRIRPEIRNPKAQCSDVWVFMSVCFNATLNEPNNNVCMLPWGYCWQN